MDFERPQAVDFVESSLAKMGGITELLKVFPIAERRYFDHEAQLYDGALTPINGRISIPQRPGLWLDPDPNVIRGYLGVGADTHLQRGGLSLWHKKEEKYDTPSGRQVGEPVGGIWRQTHVRHRG